MSIEVVLEGKLEKEKDREQFTTLLKDICTKEKLQFEDYDTFVNIEVCPQGYIECSYEGCFISLAAQTNVAGPGFHAFACTFFDSVIEESSISFTVSDPTQYYEQRNFETLKYAYFYRWLLDISTYVQEHAYQHEDLCICWRVDDYQPMPKEGMVVTPMGYIAVDDFRDLEIEELAERFFIWNQQEKTAQYYRSCAIALLCKDCYYEYSSMNEASDKTANSILDYLEAAYEADDRLPLPLRAYTQLCESIHREALIHHGIAMTEDIIGYRQELIFYPFGNWNIPIHGCCECSFDNSTQTLHFMAPYKTSDEPWHWLIKATVYSFDTPAQSFIKMLEHPKDTVMESFVIEEGDVKGKAIIEKKEDFISMIVQFNCGKDTLILEHIIKEMSDVALLRQHLEQIQHRNLNEDSLKN